MTHAYTTRCMMQTATLMVLIMLLWMPALTGCSTVVGAGSVEKYNQAPLTVSIPSGLAPQEVEEVMVEALRYRGWTVVQRSPQEVIGERDRLNFQAKAILKANGLIKILNDSYYKRPEGGSLEPGIPKGWLRNLQKDLQAGFAKKVSQRFHYRTLALSSL